MEIVAIVWTVVPVYFLALGASSAYLGVIHADPSFLVRSVVMPAATIVWCMGQASAVQGVMDYRDAKKRRDGWEAGIVLWLMAVLPVVFVRVPDVSQFAYDYRFYPIYLGTAYLVITMMLESATARAKFWEKPEQEPATS